MANDVAEGPVVYDVSPIQFIGDPFGPSPYFYYGMLVLSVIVIGVAYYRTRSIVALLLGVLLMILVTAGWHYFFEVPDHHPTSPHAISTTVVCKSHQEGAC